MSAIYVCKFMMLLSIRSIVAEKVNGAAEAADFTLEDFEAAMSAEVRRDCSAGDCDGEEALSLLQMRVSKFSKVPEIPTVEKLEEDFQLLSALNQAPESAKLEEEESSQETPAAASNELKVEDLGAALESDDDAKVEGLALVQTGASIIEGTSSPSSHQTMSGVVQADGSIEMNPRRTVVPSNGRMAISVDMHGGLHIEDSLSLMQEEARVKHNDAVEKMVAAGKQQQQVPPSVSEKGEEEEGLSLVQADTHLEQKSGRSHSMMSIAANADGTLEMEPERHTVQKDGTMHVSVDASGHFTYEK